MKPWYSSKTIWINLIALVLAAVLEWLGKLPPEASLYASFGAFVVNIALRYVSSERIGNPDKAGD